MNTNDFIIEVKTKWINENNKYSRKVIEYSCNHNNTYEDARCYIRDLNPINIYNEISDSVTENTVEITAKNKNTKEIIKSPNNIINYLLNYTRHQWLNEE